MVHVLYQTINWINVDLLSVEPPGIYFVAIEFETSLQHYSDVIMNAMALEITSVSIVCLTVCLGSDLRKHQISTSLAFVRGIPHKGSVTRKMFPFEDVIMKEAFENSSSKGRFPSLDVLDCPLRITILVFLQVSDSCDLDVWIRLAAYLY